MTARLAAALEAARTAWQSRAWAALLAQAEEVERLSDEAGAERLSVIIPARRIFDATLLRDLREQALREPELQERTARLLRWIGPDGLEALIDGVVESEAAAPRRFLHDALAAEPAAYPLLVPLLASSRAHVVRHGAELLGRLGDARAVPHLAPLLRHESAAVRGAALRSLARFDAAVVPELLREALAHPSAETRTDAARALDERHRPLVAPLLHAFNREAESEVRREMAGAIARLGAAESLVAIALDRKSLLRWNGRAVEPRVDAVAGIAAADSPETRRLLARLVRDGDAPVRAAADGALSVRRGAD